MLVTRTLSEGNPVPDVDPKSSPPRRSFARFTSPLAIFVGIVVAVPSLAAPQAARATFVATIADHPTAIEFAPGDLRRIYVATKEGRVWSVRHSLPQQTLALDISPLVRNIAESGLVGMAFDPNFQSNRHVYLAFHTGSQQGDSMISRFTFIPGSDDLIDPNSETIIWGPVPQGSSAHKGGDLEFGPDGMLYHGLGDGGTGLFSGPDIAQDLSSPKGKILRFDVRAPFPHVPQDNPLASTPGADPHIWAQGFRNPFRIDVDPATGDIYVGDVGDGAWEEITRLPAGVPLLNGGWPCVEGLDCGAQIACQCLDPGIVRPIAAMAHSGSSPFCAVIGGLVYRGSAIPSLNGHYIFADYCSGQIRALVDPAGNAASTDLSLYLNDAGAPIRTISDFTRDPNGEIWFVEHASAKIWRLDPASGIETYCSAQPNSAGTAASITAVGSTSIAASDITLRIQDLPPNQFGFLIASQGRSFIPNFAGSDGNLCLASPLFRWYASLSNAGSGGGVTYPADLAALPQGMTVDPGETWHFQYWTRDTNPLNTSTTSNGVSITFTP